MKDGLVYVCLGWLNRDDWNILGVFDSREEAEHLMSVYQNRGGLDFSEIQVVRLNDAYNAESRFQKAVNPRWKITAPGAWTLPEDGIVQ